MTPGDAKSIHRGEIWLASLSPVRGAEMDKTRPVVVVSSDAMGVLPVKIVAPCTSALLSPAAWRVPVPASPLNGLDKDTTVDLMQIRAISVLRLIHRIGTVEADVMEDIAAMIAIVVEHN